MTTSQSSNFTVNRNELIRSSFEMVGVAIAGEPLAPPDINKANIVLNMMLKAFQAHGLHVWKRKTVSFNFVANQASYTLGQKSKGTATSYVENRLVDAGADFITDDISSGDTAKNLTSGVTATVASVVDKTNVTFSSDLFPSGDEPYTITSANVSTPRPLKIIEANRLLSDGTSTSMNPLSENEYKNLPNETQTGTPISYFYDPTLNNGTLHVWLVPDSTAASTYSMEVVTNATVEDVDKPTDNFDCPSEWLEAITVNLAYRLSHRYPLESTSAKLELKKFADETLDLVIGWDTEDSSVFFAPQTERGQ